MKLRPIRILTHLETFDLSSIMNTNVSFSQAKAVSSFILATRYNLSQAQIDRVLGVTKKGNPYHGVGGKFTNMNGAKFTVAETFVSPKAYLARVGADKDSVEKETVDKETVEYFRQQIKSKKSFDPPEIHLDEGGNVIYGDGRHRAMAYALEGVEKMPVKVMRKVYTPVSTAHIAYVNI